MKSKSTLRIDNVGIVVDDLKAAIAFFVEEPRRMIDPSQHAFRVHAAGKKQNYR